MNLKNLQSRLIMCLLAVVMSSVSLFAQVTTVKHVVVRGETLEDIAKSYNVTKEEIISLNPSAAQFVYVGMELTIPKKEIAGATNTVPSQQNETVPASAQPESATGSTNDSYSSSDMDYDLKWGPIIEIGYGFIKGSDNFTYEATIGANYNITQDAYVGARIGYNSANYFTSVSEIGAYLNATTTVHILRIPLEVGYKFLDSNRKIGTVPFASLGFNIGLSGKRKYKSNIVDMKDDKLKVGGKVGIDGILGARIYLWELTLSGGYHFPFNDEQKKWFGKDAYPMISIGWMY